ncbi:MAG: hypothetical protein JWN37_868 [Candidatus Nomurabacteria bacterium]|nr:hypothetical protein [Candidatus Nomurabacteria bacterium]
MSEFKIQRQTEAEKDDYLFECFHDAGFINSITTSNYSILCGRKGTGKTAIARYLEQKSQDYGIKLSYRISIRSVSLTEGESFNDHLNSILFFIIIKTIQKFLEEKLFIGSSESYWLDFLTQNGLQDTSDYETFIETRRVNKTGFSVKGWLNSLFAKAEGGANTEDESQSTRSVISNAPSSLINSLKETTPKEDTIFIFIDDISDYLDEADEKKLKEDLVTIRELLLSLDLYNSIFRDSGKKLRFICLIRDDLFEFMQGSNINKLINDSLKLEWNEKSFASLLIRRIPYYQDRLQESLSDPIKALRSQFPDTIFSKTLENFETNRYATNFYAYMIAISFNRPRDFLKFCYAMRDRLSTKHPATFENIDSAEIEYSEYFTKELKDELFLISRLLKYNFSQDNINELIDLLSGKEGFNVSQLKTELGQYLGVKTKLGWNRIQEFIQELWWYGVIGFKEKNDKVIHFKYISSNYPLLVKKFKEYSFFLHRGLYWFAQKRKK